MNLFLVHQNISKKVLSLITVTSYTYSICVPAEVNTLACLHIIIAMFMGRWDFIVL